MGVINYGHAEGTCLFLVCDNDFWCVRRSETSPPKVHSRGLEQRTSHHEQMVWCAHRGRRFLSSMSKRVWLIFDICDVRKRRPLRCTHEGLNRALHIMSKWFGAHIGVDDSYRRWATRCQGWTACTCTGIATQEPTVTVREARESKSTRKLKKIFQKWTSSTCDFAIKIFRRIFFFDFSSDFLRSNHLRLVYSAPPFFGGYGHT